MVEKVLDFLYAKFNLKPDTWFIKPYRPHKPGITVSQLLEKLLTSNSGAEAVNYYGYSDASFRRHIKILFPNGKTSATQSWRFWLVNQTPYKWCCDCNSYQDKSNFSSNKREIDKLNSRCKTCESLKYTNNKGQFKANAAKRRAAILDRTPKWANLEKIKEIYNNCPEGYHVDHIIPLQGKNVSGLHVETNLQYLTAKDNLSKGNSFTEDNEK